MSDAYVFRDLVYPADGSVLGGIEIRLDREEKLALFGPNGAGKSSILRVIAGAVDGRTRRPDVAYLPQMPYMFRGSVRSNLVMGRPNEDAVLTLARDLGVGGDLDLDARKLSGGMAQRVAIARALAGDEPIVLLDEPLGTIDATDRSLVVDVIRRCTSGRALIAVTHAVDAAANLADTLAIVDAGRILQRGPVSEVLSRPDSHRVSEIVGQGNVLAGTVTSSTGSVARIDVDGIELTAVTDLSVGDRVLLRIAPESITVFDATPTGASNRNVVAGTVAEIIPIGSLLEVVTASPLPLRAVVTPGALDHMDIEQGSPVWFGIKASAIGVVATP